MSYSSTLRKETADFPKTTKAYQISPAPLACYILRQSRKLGIKRESGNKYRYEGKNVCKWKVVIWTNTAPKLFSTKKIGPSGMHHVLRYISLSNHERKNTFSMAVVRQALMYLRAVSDVFQLKIFWAEVPFCLFLQVNFVSFCCILNDQKYA